MTTPINGITSNDFLQLQDLEKTQQMQKQLLMNTPSVTSTLQYGLETKELTEEDVASFLEGNSMSKEGMSAFANLVKRLNDNYNRMMEFFQTNAEVGENEEAFSSLEKIKINMVMFDGICTDEELTYILEEAETEKVEEEPQEESKPWRHDEVVGAFEAFLDDLEAGKDINQMSASDHPGINAGDFNRILNDYKDDQTIGNGAAKDQFEDDTIYNDVVKRIEEDVKSGKLDDRVKVHDNDDNRAYDSKPGEEDKIKKRK